MVTGDVAIGADGIHSTVRGQLFGKQLPRYTGNVAWRGLVPAERVAHLDLGRVTGVWMGPNRSIVRRRRERAPPRYEGLDIPTRTVLLERLDSCYDFPAHPP